MDGIVVFAFREKNGRSGASRGVAGGSAGGDGMKFSIPIAVEHGRCTITGAHSNRSFQVSSASI